MPHTPCQYCAAVLFWCYRPSPTSHLPRRTFLEQERARKREEELRRPPNDIEAPQRIEAPIVRPEDKICFPIQTISLEGAESLNNDEIAFLLSPYEGTCMGYQAIGALIRDITNLYIAGGYVTSRALIPEQDLRSKHLRLMIIEGTIEEIKLNDMSLEDRTRLMTAVPFLKDRKLNLKDLEQGLDQMNRLPSSHASLRLWPGEKEGGTQVIMQDNPKDRFRGTVAMDNYGQKNTGENRIRLGVDYDNMLWLNDRQSFYYIGSKDTNALAYNISVPYGYWTVSGDMSYSEYFSVLEGAAELFGTTYNNTLTVDRVVWRGAQGKTSMSAALNVKESSRLLNDILLTPQPLTVMRLAVNQTYRTDKAMWYGDFTYSRGLAALGAIKDAPNLSSDAPRAQFDKFDGGITYIRPEDFGRYTASLRGQYALNPLYGSEQISMGDNGTVRGFSGSVLSGDSGIYLRNETAFILPDGTKAYLPETIKDGFEPYLFMDSGFAKLKSDNEYNFLAGTGGGLRFNWGRYSADLSLGIPLYRSHGIASDGVEIYFNVSAKLF
jgi:hemolysin activation/secretion protein